MGVVTVSKDVFNRIMVSFPYDPQLVEKVKTIEGRRWHPQEKYWSFPNTDGTLKKILEVFEGEKIHIDPQLQADIPKIVIARMEGPKQSRAGQGHNFEDLRRELITRKYSRETVKAYLYYNRDFISFTVICSLRAKEDFMDSTKSMVFLTFVLLFSVSVGCNHNIRPNSDLPTGANEGLSMIKEWRSGCEQRARMLKTYYKPETNEYKKAYGLYIETKTKSDAWIETLIIDLQMGGKPSNRYKSLLEEAAKRTVEFENYVKSVCEPQPSTKGLPDKGLPEILAPINIGDIIEKLTNAGIKLWETWHKAKEKEKAKIINVIKEQKWPDFNDIK